MKTHEILEIRKDGAPSEFFVFTTARRAVQFLINRGLAENWVNVGSIGARYYFATAGSKRSAVVNNSMEKDYRAVIRTAFVNMESQG